MQSIKVQIMGISASYQTDQKIGSSEKGLKIN
jgi:hypothetical protein